MELNFATRAGELSSWNAKFGDLESETATLQSQIDLCRAEEENCSRKQLKEAHDAEVATFKILKLGRYIVFV